MTNPLATSKTLIITGMHRSGTSLTASLVHRANVDMGENLLGENLSNPRGHFEDLDFLKFHENILQSHGLGTEGWVLQQQIPVTELFLKEARTLIHQRQFKPIWGWKDPRTTLFLDFWQKLLPQAHFLFIYRNPWEVIDSLYRRGDPSFTNNPYLALQVWINYNQAIINFYDQHYEKCILLNVNSINKSPERLIGIVNKQLSISLDALSEKLYEDSLFHRQVSYSHQPGIIEMYFPEALAVYDQLDKRAQRFDDDPEIYQRLDDVADTDNNKIWILKDWQISCKLKKDLTFAAQQLHQTKAQLEHYHGQEQQKQEHLINLETQLQATQRELEQSYLQQQATERELEQSRLQQQATERELEQSRLQQQATERELEQSYLQQQATERELEQSRLQQQATERELENPQDWLHQEMQKFIDQSQTDIEMIQKEWDETQIKLQEAHHNWQQSQNQLQKIIPVLEVQQQQIQLFQAELDNNGQQRDHLQEVILAMKTSKFWKLRARWLKIKSALGVGLGNEIADS